MKSESIAIVTSSSERELELCSTLNRSVLEFLPASVRHYIVVDGRDLRMFAPLNSRRTVVIATEDVLPHGFLRTARLNRWLAPGQLMPLSSRMVRQIARIATASLLAEATLLMVDSDAVFVRDVDLSVFSHDGRTRLYTRRGGITAGMTMALNRHATACALLGVASGRPPLDDYTGRVISWRRDLVLHMRERVEQIAGRPWYEEIARSTPFSDCMLYGVYVDSVAGIAGNAWTDEHPRCSLHEAAAQLSADDIATFVGTLTAEDCAMAIGEHSTASPETRAAMIRLATNGRL